MFPLLWPRQALVWHLTIDFVLNTLPAKGPCTLERVSWLEVKGCLSQK